MGASLQTITATVTESTDGATLHYTMDGSVPTLSAASIASGGSVLLSQNATLNVRCSTSSTTTSSLVATRYSEAGQVSAGTQQHSLALKNDGTVWAWGNNAYGQLGNGTTSNSSVAVQVSGLSGIVAVAAGQDESFAVDAYGNVWAWGYNTSGQLGNGSTSNATVPSQINGLSGIVAIASAGYHTLALKTDGSVWAFGADNIGQVGNGSLSASVTMPTQVVAPSGQTGYLQGMVAIAAGQSHSLAVDNTGKVWSWGDNSHGQLGNGTYASQSSPVQVGSSFNGIVSIGAGIYDSYAVKSDGSAWAWGDNLIGELGNGTTTSNTTPTQVNNSTGSIAAISNQTAVAATGQVYTWGDNSNGRLGTGSTSSNATLPQLIGGAGVPAAPFWALVALSAVLLAVIARKISPRKPLAA